MEEQAAQQPTDEATPEDPAKSEERVEDLPPEEKDAGDVTGGSSNEGRSWVVGY